MVSEFNDKRMKAFSVCRVLQSQVLQNPNYSGRSLDSETEKRHIDRYKQRKNGRK